MIPQIIYVVWMSIEMLLQSHNHGKLKKEIKHNFWVQLMNWGIITVLMIFGGFFDVWFK